MHKENRNWIDITNKIKTQNVRELVSHIDFETFFNNDISSLYYIFPLLEWLITKIASGYDVEKYNQGETRTIIAILDKNPNLFSNQIKKLILKYYGENGLRNIVMHYSDEKKIPVNKRELYELLEMLLIKLDNDSSNTYDSNIELL